MGACCSSGGQLGAVENWAKNITFYPSQVVHPKSVKEIERILNAGVPKGVRVAGTLHSFNTSCSTGGPLLILDKFKKMELEPDGKALRVGAGIWARGAEAFLKEKDLTLPVALTTTTQNIVGGCSHATRSAGTFCMSEYVIEATVTSISEQGVASTQVIKGDELRYAACSLGLLGVISEVVIQVRKDFRILEKVELIDDYHDAIPRIIEKPKTYGILVPYIWNVACRFHEETEKPLTTSTFEDTRRDWGLAFGTAAAAELDALTGNIPVPLKLLEVVWESLKKHLEFEEEVLEFRDALDQKFTNILPSDIQTEIQMPAEQLADAVQLMELVVEVFAGTEEYRDPTQKWVPRLQEKGLWEPLLEHFGTFTINFIAALCVGQPEKQSIMSPMYVGGSAEGWHGRIAVEFYTPRSVGMFHTFCDVLQSVILEFCDARLHWGKVMDTKNSRLMRINRERHPGLKDFLEARKRYDPTGFFLNDHYKRALGLTDADEAPAAAAKLPAPAVPSGMDRERRRKGCQEARAGFIGRARAKKS